MRKLLTLCFALLLSTPSLKAQNTPTEKTIVNYINQYKGIAISEQIRTGIPAAITLAQGIYESGAGTSVLALKANNHFGIKCKKSWKGATFLHTDDKKDECFRKYASAEQSYIDHSNFLENNTRYDWLFSIQPTNYKAWAHGLQKSGYATNPHYARKLIGYIKTYHLQDYTLKALNTKKQAPVIYKQTKPSKKLYSFVKQNKSKKPSSETKKVSETATQPILIGKPDSIAFYQITHKNGLKGFYAPKGDLLLEYAIKHRIRYGKLLRQNDLPDAPLEADMFVYLEHKRKFGRQKKYQVPQGLDLLQISQALGMQLSQLRLFNHLIPGEEPAAGTWLYLQEMAPQKPKLRGATKTTTEHETKIKTVNISSKKQPASDYIETNHSSKPTVPTTTQKPSATKASTKKIAQKKHPVTAPKSIVKHKKTSNPKHATSAIEPTHKAVKPTPPKNLTPLQKLRAKMNKIVYGTESEQAETSQQATTPEPKKTKTTTTTPKKEKSGSPKKNKTRPKTSPKSSSMTPTEKLRSYMKTVAHKKANQPETKSHNTLPPSQTADTENRNNTTTHSKQKTYYTVHKGDTAFGIATKFGITLEQLRNWNQLPKSMTVMIGQRLRVK